MGGRGVDEDAPEEHPCLGLRPLRETLPAEVPLHRVLEHVALVSVERGDGVRVRFEPGDAPRGEERVRDGLGEGGGLEGGYCCLFAVLPCPSRKFWRGRRVTRLVDMRV